MIRRMTMVLVLAGCGGAPDAGAPAPPRGVASEEAPAGDVDAPRAATDCTPTAPDEAPPMVGLHERMFDEADALVVDARARLDDGDAAGAEAGLLAALSADPYHLAAHAQLVELYAMNDRPRCVAILLDRLAQLAFLPSRAGGTAAVALDLTEARGLDAMLRERDVHEAAGRFADATGVRIEDLGARPSGAGVVAEGLDLLPPLPPIPVGDDQPAR